MDFFVDLISNFPLVCAITGWLLAQFLKVFTGIFKVRKFSIGALLGGTGGMPSSHSAAVCALAGACALREGWDSTMFGVAMLFLALLYWLLGPKGRNRPPVVVGAFLAAVLLTLGTNLFSSEQTLAEKYGYPYNQIDGRMFAHGGGGYGRRNLCGSLGGAFAVLNLFTTGGDMSGIRTKIYEWYESTNLPIYQPADKPEHPVHTVAGSELCKDSVGNWMAASGHAFGDPERGTRCASLSADVAGQLVAHLNALFGFTAPVEEEPAPELAANEYIGVGKSDIGGEIKVKVTMDGDKIAKIEVLSNNETPAFFAKVDPALTDAIVAANGTAGVDTVAGATCSSKGIIEAVNNALAQIKK